MRRFELLVNEVRESTDTTDINSVGVYEVMRYFNDAQKQLQKIIFTANPSSDMFVKQKLYSVISGQVQYDLPSDIYAHSSITSMNTIKDSHIAQTLTRVAYREKDILWGYAILDKTFVLTTNPEVSTVSDILMNYVYKLPVISYRLGKVESVNAQVVTVSGASLIDSTDFTERYDKYSIVTSEGVQTAVGLELNDNTGLDFTFTGDISGISIGDYIVCGESGTSHSFLPDSCEPYLMAYVQRRILNKISSSEVTTENVFTMEERSDIEDLFKDTVKDALYPVSEDTYYLGY